MCGSAVPTMVVSSAARSSASITPIVTRARCLWVSDVADIPSPPYWSLHQEDAEESRKVTNRAVGYGREVLSHPGRANRPISWRQCGDHDDDERTRVVGRGVRARPTALAGGRISHARLGERG